MCIINHGSCKLVVETTPLPEDEKIEALLEGVKICTTALDSLEFSKKGYGLLSLLCFILLYTCGSMELPGILYLLPPVTRLLIWVVFFFSTIMGKSNFIMHNNRLGHTFKVFIYMLYFFIRNGLESNGG